MAGPWTQYQPQAQPAPAAPAAPGPWTQYQPAAPAAPAAPAPQQAPQAPQAAPPRTSAEQLGLGTRASVHGLLGLPSLVYDVAALPQNLLSNIPGLEFMRVAPAQQQISQGMTAVGLPEPRDSSERLMGAAISGAAGLPTGYGAGGAVSQIGTSAAQRLAGVLRANPATQAVTGVTGGLGSQAAQEVVDPNAHPAAKLALGVAGGFVGAATPSAAVGAGRRVMTPLPAQLTAEERRLIDVARREGVDLPVSTQTGSRGMRVVEETLATIPGASGAAAKQQQAMREQFNAAALRRTGETATDVSPQTIDSAFARLGRDFDDLAVRTTVNLDNTFANEIGSVAKNYAKRLPSDVRPVVVSRLRDLAARVGTTIQGDEFQTISSDLRRAAREYSATPDVQRALNSMATSLDDAAERSMGPVLADAWRETRGQYRNLLAIDKAAKASTQQDQAAGNLSFGAFRNAVRQMDETGYGRGRGDLNDLARLGNLMAQKTPDSGTAQRSLAMKMLQLSPPAAVGGMIGGIPGVALAVASPWAAQRAIQSPLGRAYLTNQAVSGPSPISPEARRAGYINALTQGAVP